jgi:hypothetical protein
MLVFPVGQPKDHKLPFVSVNSSKSIHYPSDAIIETGDSSG